MRQLNYRDYIPNIEISKPNPNDFTTLTLHLHNAQGVVVDKISISKTAYLKDYKSYKNYTIDSQKTKKEKLSEAVKLFEKSLSERNKKFEELNKLFIEDIAGLNNTTVEVVEKAIKVLEWVNDEYESLVDHISNIGGWKKDSNFDEDLFNKRVELLSDIIDRIK